MSTPEPFAVLHGHQYMNLHSYRKSGAEVITPVWFAQEGGRIYFLSQPQTGKIKRIRHNRAVLIGPADQAGKPLGDTVRGQARLLDGDEARHADQVMSRKYGLMKAILLGMARLRGRGTVFVEITPG